MFHTLQFNTTTPTYTLAQINNGQMKELEAMFRRVIQEEKTGEPGVSAKMVNEVYRERNMCVALIMRMALALGLTTGIGTDPAEPEWKVAYVDLPSGQVSWHIHQEEMKFFEEIPAYQGKWDGHDTESKYKKVVNPKLEAYNRE